MNKSIRYFFISLLIFGSLLLRLYRIDATQTFLEDEGRDMLIVKRMLDTKLPVLLGPQTSTGNMYLGPFYYYLITPALILSGGNPIGPAIFIAITGVITTLLLYYLGRRWFGEWVGWAAAIMYGVLPYPVMFSRNSWNPNLAPLVMLLLLWAASQIKLHPPKISWKPIFIFGLLTGVLMQLHYMALVGIGASGIYVIAQNYRQLKTLALAMLIGLLGLLTTLSPFIAFEIRNNFVNSRALVGFLTGTTEQNISYDQSLFGYLGNVQETYVLLLSGQLGSQAFHPEEMGEFIAIIFSAVIILNFLRLKSSCPMRLMLTTFIVSTLVLGFYQDQIHLHYLGFALPLTYLILASTLSSPRLRIPFAMIIFAVCLYNTPTLLGYINSSATNQVTKARQVAEYIKNQAGDRPYNVVSRQLGQTSPFQYFLSLQANKPSNELESTLFIICDGSPCNKDDETTTLLYLTGPSHPALKSYLAHPELNEFRGNRQMLSNEIVNFGIWVAELRIKK